MREVQPQDQPDDSEPTPERQAELRAAYEANMAAGQAPYAGVAIRTRGELQWVMRERAWSTDREAGGSARADLRDADLGGIILSRARLYEADLSGANLSGAVLRHVRLSGTQLPRAQLMGADLSGAHLNETNLTDADLTASTLTGALLGGADLSGAELHFAVMDVLTVLAEARLSSATRLADVVWNNVPLTRIRWETLKAIGDEGVARNPMDSTGKTKDKDLQRHDYEKAARAYGQLAVVLRDQGVNEAADRFAYRAHRLQRIVLRRQAFLPSKKGQPVRLGQRVRRLAAYIGSGLLDLIAGYGYRPLRSFVAYAVVVLGFAAAYFALGGAGGKAIAWNEAIVISMTAFHGRGFFSAVFQPGDLQAAVAAVEAFFGLLIEITFIATFTQRFFAR
jgi:hypothetical protein